MTNTYRKFLSKNLDLSSLGVECRVDNAPYFCTPKGASIIGWAGVDGIHYCFIRGFGEMVFSVSPMNDAPHYVHPLAKDFRDFLRLLLSCGGADGLEQAWMWDKSQFERFLRENPKTEEQENALARLAEGMKLTAIEQPWEYIKALQSSFDGDKIKYTEDFYDLDLNPAAEPAMPPWKVSFSGGFWGPSGRERPGKEVRLDAQFAWADRHWRIPAAYLCGKGLVLDFCMRAEAEKIRAFQRKWTAKGEDPACRCMTREQQMEMELENPLRLDFKPWLEVNGRRLRMTHGFGAVYNPCLPEGEADDLEGKRAVSHYGLDLKDGWVFFRAAFPWVTKRRPALKTLSLTMEQQPVSIPGPRFKAAAPGDTVTFFNPADGERHRLTVREIERSTMPEERFGREGWDYPTHYWTMCYTVSPEIAEGTLTVLDCAEGDRPREKSPSPHGPRATGFAAVMGIIGGADGPTALVFGQGRPRAACSALHFLPADQVEWRMVFHKKQFADRTIRIKL